MSPFNPQAQLAAAVVPEIAENLPFCVYPTPNVVFETLHSGARFCISFMLLVPFFMTYHAMFKYLEA